MCSVVWCGGSCLGFVFTVASVVCEVRSVGLWLGLLRFI